MAKRREPPRVVTVGKPDPRALDPAIAEDFYTFIGRGAVEFFKDPENRRWAEEWKAQKRADGWDWCV